MTNEIKPEDDNVDMDELNKSQEVLDETEIDEEADEEPDSEIEDEIDEEDDEDESSLIDE